nr:15006_t:CDS:2 [Entrophospora candida]CAG8442294.1 14826_t:CDS:2 [Entrophospora candida]
MENFQDKKRNRNMDELSHQYNSDYNLLHQKHLKLINEKNNKAAFVENLIDATRLILEVIWPGCDNTKSNLLSLKTFLEEILKRSRTSCSTLQTALFYLIRIRPKIEILKEQIYKISPTAPITTILCCRRMFLISLIIASKYLQDRNHSNKAWSKITGLAVKEINSYEIFFLRLINYNLYVTYDSFENWCVLLLSNIRSISGEGFIQHDGFKKLENQDKVNSFREILNSLNIESL